MYSSKSKTTQEFCQKAGFIQSVNFVETRRVGDRVYVRGTCGKQHEFRALRAACASLGAPYIYSPKS
jgi:hypothetical protein